MPRPPITQRPPFESSGPPRPTRRRGRRTSATVVTALAVAVLPTLAPPAGATTEPSAQPQPTQAAAGADRPVQRQAIARGRGGAVSSADPSASRVGLRVLRRGGNATDAAVATAAALGVTEPFSSGIGGGGYFVHYDAETGRISTLDGRETAPASMPRDAFIDPSTGAPYTFFPDLVTSGVSVGVPGTPATWRAALKRWGTTSLGEALAPAAALARRGFPVDETFRKQVRENRDRFAAFPATARLYLPNGHAPRLGRTLRNRDLAKTYDLLGSRGTKPFYQGALAEQISRVVRSPRARDHTDLPVPPGFMTPRDLAKYRIIERRPTHVQYRNLDVYGMAPSSSGGTTVGETLNILDDFRLSPEHLRRSLHLYLEASALAYADRSAYVGDPAYSDVPTKRLLSQQFADKRACRIDPQQAATKPVLPGRLKGNGCAEPSTTTVAPDTEGRSTTHLSVVDASGDAVSYTLTIEQTGGSGMVVPNRGFILNNELTDFSLEYVKGDPNRIQGGKRPRSSMSPTIVLRNGHLQYVIGSPGGSTIITTVLQVLINRVDFDMSLLRAVAAPRASQRNAPDVTAERSFIRRYGSLLRPLGHTFIPPGDVGTSAAEIGTVAAIEVKKRGQLVAVAEPKRRGGGDARVVCPAGNGCVEIPTPVP